MSYSCWSCISFALSGSNLNLEKLHQLELEWMTLLLSPSLLPSPNICSNELKSAPFVLVGDVSWAIYRHVCYCVRPSERHEDLEQATMLPAGAPGSLRGNIKNMWLQYDEFRWRMTCMNTDMCNFNSFPQTLLPLVCSLMDITGYMARYCAIYSYCFYI